MKYVMYEVKKQKISNEHSIKDHDFWVKKKKVACPYCTIGSVPKDKRSEEKVKI